VIVKGKRKAEFFLGKKLSDPKYTGKKFFVLSETGLRLFGGYKTEKEAKKRLGQVEFFKRRGNPASPRMAKLMARFGSADEFESANLGGFGAKSDAAISESIWSATRGRPDMGSVRREVQSNGRWWFLDEVDVWDVDPGTHGPVVAQGDEDLKRPIVVGLDTGVLDGRHRVMLARERGVGTLPAYIPAAVFYRRYAPQANPLPLPLGNPSSFWDRSHDWDQVLIQKGKTRRTRGQILEYYKKNAKKIWPYLEGQTVMVIFGRKKNDFVLRRKGPDGEYIKLTKLEGIDDPHSFEYWIHRRVIEFHPVITGKSTSLIWIDVDPYKKARPKSMAKMQRQIRKAIPLMKRLLKDEFGVKKAYVWRSGKKDGGWHVEGDLPRKMNVNAMRKKLRAALDKYFAGDPDFTTTIAKPGQIRLDTTLTKTMGSLRAPYSYTVDGAQKLPVKVSGMAPSLKRLSHKPKRRRNPGLSEPDYELMKQEVERGIEPEFETIGMGTTRQVYEVSIRSGDPFIFKADFGPRGRRTQTSAEISCIKKGKSPLFPEVYDHDPKGRWAEVEMLEPLDAMSDGEAVFWDLSGIDWDDFDAAFAGVDTRSPEQVANAREALVAPGNTKGARFFDELVRVSKICNLDTSEMGLLENWGASQDGGLKLIDLGGAQ